MGSDSQWQERRQQQEQQIQLAMRRERSRSIIWQTALAAQSIERAGLDGVAILLVLFVCTGGLALVLYLLYCLASQAIGAGKVAWFLSRLCLAARRGTSERAELRARGRHDFQGMAVRLRDRPTGILHRNGKVARLTCRLGRRLAESAATHYDLCEEEAGSWHGRLCRTVGVDPNSTVRPSGEGNRRDSPQDPLESQLESNAQIISTSPRSTWTANAEMAGATDIVSADPIDDLLDQDVTMFGDHNL